MPVRRPGPTERANLLLDAYEIPRRVDNKTLTLSERIEKMGRSVPVLMGVTEAADALGVKTANLDRVQGMPAPVAELMRGRIWLASDIEALAAERRERNGGGR